MNYLSIIVASVVSMIIGGFWYSPAVFGKQWVKLMGFSDSDMKKAKDKGMMKSYAGTFVSLLVMNFVLAYVISVFDATDIIGGVQIGFELWLGFVASVMSGMMWWDGRPLNLYLIHVAHWLVVMMAAGAILAVWQ